MNHLESTLSWFTLGFVSILCGFVFKSRVYKLLPFFAAYSYELLVSTIVVWATYEHAGFDSLTSYYVYWASILINAAVRSLVIVELCRYGLRAYRGIWALVWRLLAVLSIVLILRAVMDAWGQPDKIAIYGATLDRDLALASIVILASLLIIRNYYGLDLEPLQKAIAFGICFFSAVDVIGNSILRSLYKGYLFNWFVADQNALWPALKTELTFVNDLWSTVHLFSFMFAIGVWCYALRKPLPAPAEAPVLLPAEVYRELSPEINLRLATYNNRLVELLKP